MILHLVFDDKFIDYAINLFDQVAPSENEFLAVIPYAGYEFKYIKQVERLNVIVYSETEIENLVKRGDQYQAIVFHSLFSYFFHKVIGSINEKKTKLVWIFWGGEFYDYATNVPLYRGKLTSALYSESSFFEKVKTKLFSILRRMRPCKKGGDIIKNVRKLSYIVTPFFDDYDIVRRTWQTNAQYLWWNYYSIEETVGNLMDRTINGNHILLGNSSTPSNNHVEVLSVLQKMDLSGRKVFIPLSYGDPKYAEFVQKEVRERLDAHAEPLLTFMERDEYNKIMLSCGVVIMNHYRQQALGNIVTALWLGAKIYLSERSPIYRHFTKLGAIIYNVENDLTSDNPAALSPLSDQEKTINKKVIYAEYSKENMLEKTRLLVRQLM